MLEELLVLAAVQEQEMAQQRRERDVALAAALYLFAG